MLAACAFKFAAVSNRIVVAFSAGCVVGYILDIKSWVKLMEKILNSSDLKIYFKYIFKTLKSFSWGIKVTRKDNLSGKKL